MAPQRGACEIRNRSIVLSRIRSPSIARPSFDSKPERRGLSDSRPDGKRHREGVKPAPQRGTADAKPHYPLARSESGPENKGHWRTAVAALPKRCPGAAASAQDAWIADGCGEGRQLRGEEIGPEGGRRCKPHPEGPSGWGVLDRPRARESNVVAVVPTPDGTAHRLRRPPMARSASGTLRPARTFAALPWPAAAD